MYDPRGRAQGRITESARLPSPLLVGRAREQKFLLEEMTMAFDGLGRLVVLTGEAGIGKTALANGICEEASARGAFVLSGHCFDLTNAPPYGLWLELFDGYRLASGNPEIPVSFTGGKVTHVSDQALLFAEVSDFVSHLARKSPTLVVLEDLHWADSASIELVRHIARRLRLMPVLMLVTCRVDEPVRQMSLADWLPAIMRESEGQQLNLRSLDAASLRGLVNVRYDLHPSDEDRLVNYLVRHSEGNPFFATELLRGLEEADVLHRFAAEWALASLAGVAVPSLLRQVVESRVARLGETVRRQLETASVIGQEVHIGLWAEVSGLAERELTATIDQAVRAFLLNSESPGTHVRFVHSLTRDALYERVLPPVRRALHRQIADALVATSDPDPDMVAFHLQAAGDLEAWKWLIHAASRAQETYAWLIAADRIQASVDILATLDGFEEKRARHACILASLWRFSDPAKGIEALNAAMPLAERVGNDVLLEELSFFRGLLECYLGEFKSGRQDMTVGTRGLKLLPATNWLQSASIDAMWLKTVMPVTPAIDQTIDDHAETGHRSTDVNYHRLAMIWPAIAPAGHAETTTHAEHGLSLLGPETRSQGPMRSTSAFLRLALGIGAAAQGRPAESIAAFKVAREVFSQLDHHALVAFIFLNEAQDVSLTYRADEPSARRQVVSQAEAALERAGGAFRLGVSASIARLGCLFLDGQWDEADSILQNSADPGISFLRRETDSARALLARARGEPEIAWSQILSLLPEGPATEPGDCIHQHGLFMQRMAAHLSIDEGALESAHHWLDAHDLWLSWSKSVLGRAEGLVVWARLHQASGELSRARLKACDAMEHAESLNQPLVKLAAHRLLGQIDTQERHYSDAETHFQAAIELADGCEAPYERALTLLAHAHLLERQRMREPATSELAVAMQTLKSLGVRSIAGNDWANHALHDQSLSVASLTAREREILHLLSLRLTNPEIADRLFISPRTVQTHVAHVFQKLGVNNRREAAEAAKGLELG